VLAPGERWHYSNLAFVLLGELIARLTQMPYEDYVEQRILQPLGMARTGFAPKEPYAIAYSPDAYSDVVHQEPMMVDRTGGIAAAGQLWSTVEDLAKWSAFLSDPSPDVLDPEAVELMTSVQAMADPYRWQLAWGVGLMLVRRDDVVYCGHDGGMPGYIANVLASRDEKLGAAVLMNTSTNADPSGVAVALIDQTRERFPPEAQAWRPGEGAPQELAPALGRWWSEGAEFVLRWRDGHLEMRWAEAPEWTPWARFEQLDDTRFRTVFGRERGELLRIVRDDDGAPTKLYWATYPMTRAPQVFGSGD
jgi:CubicO group peptidase (beta-lactamase class C family)